MADRSEQAKYGKAVRLKRDVERYPFFVAEAGATGRVVEASNECLAVLMDEKLAGAEAWDNEVIWSCHQYGDDFYTAVAEDLETIEEGS